MSLPAQPEPPPLGPGAASAPLRRRRAWLWVAGALFLVVLVAVAVLVSTVGSSFAVRGTLSLTDGVIREGGAGCAGGRGYDDIHTGAAVKVYDPAGKVVAMGRIDKATLSDSLSRCVFDFTVEDVPRGHDFYSVEVSHRGKVTFPADRIQNEPVALTLG